MVRRINVDVEVTEDDIKIVQSLADGKEATEISSDYPEFGSLRQMYYRIDNLKAHARAKTAAHLVAIFLRNKIIK